MVISAVGLSHSNAVAYVIDPAAKTPWIRVGLRGRRPVPRRVEVNFRFRVAGGDSVSVEGLDGKRVVRGGTVKALRDRWTDATVTLEGMKALEEVRFRVASGATVGVDDVLVYEPGD